MDKAWGYAIETTDGDTLRVRIASVSRYNSYRYGDVERVRLRRTDAAELYERRGPRERRQLRRQVAGRRLTLEIYGRDVYGRLVAELVFEGARR